MLIQKASLEENNLVFVAKTEGGQFHAVQVDYFSPGENIKTRETKNHIALALHKQYLAGFVCLFPDGSCYDMFLCEHEAVGQELRVKKTKIDNRYFRETYIQCTQGQNGQAAKEEILFASAKYATLAARYFEYPSALIFGSKIAVK